MVTKPPRESPRRAQCLILAKIHMVTKLQKVVILTELRLILAKIHMVTKQPNILGFEIRSLILAKIHMVTKHTS